MEHQKWQLEEAVESLNEQCAVVKNLRDSNSDLTLVYEQLLRDYDVLKSDDADKSKKLLELLTANNRREYAQLNQKVLTYQVK